jgi:hypothetical protein
MRHVSRSRLGVSVALPFSLALLAGGCHRSDVATAKEPTGPLASARLDDHRSFGAEVAVENLQVWPIVSDQPADVGPFLTLQEAQAQGKARVHEREQGAEVNELVLENTGDLPILVCAGTLVKGGQQDRQIGQDLIALAHSTVSVDAFCVEQGRWTGGSADFVAMGCMTTVGVRASGQYGSNQSQVWNEVEQIDRAAAVTPATGTLVAAIDVADTAVVERRGKIEKQVRASFDALLAKKTTVVGFAYAIDGKPVTIRAFADARLLKAQLDPFVRTMSMEAELAARDRETAAPAVAPRRATVADLLALVHATASADDETFKTCAGNVNHYRKGELAASSACYLRSIGYGGAAITEDWTARPAESKGEPPPILRDDER